MVEKYEGWTAEQKVAEIQRLIVVLADLEYESRVLGPSLSRELVEREMSSTSAEIRLLNESLKPKEKKPDADRKTVKQRNRRSFYMVAGVLFVAFLATGAVLAACITGVVVVAHYLTSAPEEPPYSPEYPPPAPDWDPVKR